MVSFRIAHYVKTRQGLWTINMFILVDLRPLLLLRSDAVARLLAIAPIDGDSVSSP